MMLTMRALPIALVCLLTGCGSSGLNAPKSASPAAGAKDKELSPDARLTRGTARLGQSRYADAEADLTAALAGAKKAEALLALSELMRITGRYPEAIERAKLAGAAGADAQSVALARASALAVSGEVDAALATLREVTAKPVRAELRLLQGELLLELGKRAAAEPVLLTIIEDYNEDRIAESDGPGLARVGRAAHLLRSPKDANDAFDQAERAEANNVQTLLYRAQLYLEKYDPGHAEEVLTEALQVAPRHPEANMLLAEVRLAQALDFDEAERLARLALTQNPKLAHAYFVLAGIAVRDQDLPAADRFVSEGLRGNPRDLQLLAMRATVRFLSEDQPGFEQQKAQILRLNPEYSKLYTIVGEFADWEHRYDEIVVLMKEAVALDAKDARAAGELGFNLIRSGKDSEGVAALAQSFRLDPFNVRVYNTLEMYEGVIAKDYVTVTHPRFTIRYRKDERDLLDRYVPSLMNQAFESMQKSYGFTPELPIGVELYAERENFGIRTGGLPQIAIQGVCFGRTLASMSPANESFNLGMTLWHELSHVFHIQMSRSRVPRWFTEGLAEYETIIARPEWVRENDQELFEAVRTDRLPALGNMSRAFTRAEELQDVGTAYYASSQIMVMMAKEYGHQKLAAMLRAWGAGKTSDQVMQGVLGKQAAELDQEFKRFAQQKLAHFGQQFMPMQRKGRSDKLMEEAKKAPKDTKKQLRVVLALLRDGARDQAEKLLLEVEKLEPSNADARFLRAELSQQEDPDKAIAKLTEMIEARQDGYAVRLLHARLLMAKGDDLTARTSLEKASSFDPLAATPHYMLAEIAHNRADDDRELAALRRLAELEQHENKVYRRLLALLASKKAWDEMVKLGDVAVYADMAGFTTHRLFAEALAETGNKERAVFELESATLSPAEPDELASAHRKLAELYASVGRGRDAAKARKRAQEIAASAPPAVQ
jgi:cytochrome c-type biogenesis protein CcmH/NrfG